MGTAPNGESRNYQYSHTIKVRKKLDWRCLQMQSKDELVLDESLDMSKLGKRIREAREARSMTQEALATACDCVYKHIGAIENG